MKNEPMPSEAKDLEPFYHGTKAALQPGELLEPGYSSNFGERRKANYIYLTATLDAATWGAELAVGEGPGRIYRVAPTGPFEGDPNLTDKTFPGNPTRSYRLARRCEYSAKSWNGSHTRPKCSRACGTTLRSSSGWASRQSTTELPRTGMSGAFATARKPAARQALGATRQSRNQNLRSAPVRRAVSLAVDVGVAGFEDLAGRDGLDHQ